MVAEICGDRSVREVLLCTAYRGSNILTKPWFVALNVGRCVVLAIAPSCQRVSIILIESALVIEKVDHGSIVSSTGNRSSCAASVAVVSTVLCRRADRVKRGVRKPISCSQSRPWRHDRR